MQRMLRFIGLAAIVAASASCGDAVRQASGSAYLVIDTLVGNAQSGKPGSFQSVVLSDVLTIVTSGGLCSQTSPCPTAFDDVGQVTMRLAPKNLGSPGAPTPLTTNNEITITRYHVEYVRADGRNTPGVDVPYAFDGAATGTVPVTGQVTMSFELVRNIAKSEPPLIALVTNPTIITTIANVTFYGQDRAGNLASVTGQIQVDFGNFGDQ